MVAFRRKYGIGSEWARSSRRVHMEAEQMELF
jgi:hypothetical protein